jgi:hypothetical protein
MAEAIYSKPFGSGFAMGELIIVNGCKHRK